MLAEMVFELDPNMKSYAAQGYDQQKLERPDELRDVKAKRWPGPPIPGYP